MPSTQRRSKVSTGDPPWTASRGDHHRARRRRAGAHATILLVDWLRKFSPSGAGPPVCTIAITLAPRVHQHRAAVDVDAAVKPSSITGRIRFAGEAHPTTQHLFTDTDLGCHVRPVGPSQSPGEGGHGVDRPRDWQATARPASPGERDEMWSKRIKLP